MTSNPSPTEEVEPFRIVAAEEKRDTTNDLYPFMLPDEDTVLTGRRPKTAVLIRLVGGMLDDGNPLRQAATFDEFLDKVLDEKSVAHLRERMEDPDDVLDIDHAYVKAMFQHLVGIWYGPTARPTGGRRASSASSSRTGKRSTARARSGGSTRSR